MAGSRLCVPALLLLAGLAPLAAQTVHETVTTTDLATAMKPMPDAVFAAASAPVAASGSIQAPVAIDVDEAQRFQTMDGFGAAMTDGSAWLLQERLPAPLRVAVMTQLFDPKQGIGLSFLRQPIASSDLSRNHYSFDDVPAGEQDPELRRFSVEHDDAYVFPILREALKLNPAITVMATPWSPPAWMKTKPTMNGGALRVEDEAVYARYLVRSVQAFEKAGVPVTFLSVQNEPLNETHNYPGTLMLADQAARLIGRYLGPDLQQAGLATQVLAYDHNWDHPEYPLAVLADAAAAPFVAGTAFHCYGGAPEAQERVHQQLPGKGIWLTECSGGTWQRESPLLSTAHLLIRSTRQWAKAVVLWTIALDTEHNPHAGGCGTCRGLVTVDLHASPTTVTYNGDFYALGHASKFVLPGATRIGSTSFGPTGLETTAFQNRDGSIALLVLNNRSQAAGFSIRWHGQTLPGSLPAQSLATYTWSPAR